MKQVSFIVLLFITLTSLAQDVVTVRTTNMLKAPGKTTVKKNKYSLQQFMGRWQEISRTDRKENSSVPFTDTLFFYFSGNNEVYTRDGVNMSLRGNAGITSDDVLEVAADVFTIKSVNNNQAVLDDGDKYIHTFIKKKIFWHETLPSNSVNPEILTTPVKTNFSAIKGKWTVYRRDAKPGATDNNELLIKTLNIGERKNDDTMNGEVIFYKKDHTETQPCTISLNGETIYIVTDKHSWHMDVYKADGREFVFGDASLMYYCKEL